MESRFSLNGKIALIAGAGRGIGRAIALGYAEAGADLVLGSRTLSEVEALARDVHDHYSVRASAQGFGPPVRHRKLGSGSDSSQ